MFPKNMCIKSILLASLLIGFTQSAWAGDWPMWRYDIGRTSSTPEELSTDLYPQWIIELEKPKSCWPYTQFRMLFDQSYEPVVTGDLMFIPSMVRDRVTAHDIHTGELRWSYYADGPVRFAPIAWNGKVYFISDDSCLYCLDAPSGKLLWKFQGGPSKYKVLGNERLVSMWCARGGPVLHEGVIYFAAGIWPFMGSFIHALNAETGEIVWTNGGSCSDFILQPHSSPAFAGVSPQGYFAISGEKLLVSSGRSVPAVYDLHTGEFLYFQTVTKKGGYEILTTDQWFINEGIIYKTEDGSPMSMSKASIVVDDIMIGADEKGVISAQHITPEWVEFKDKRGDPQKRAKFKPIWETQQPIEKVFIRAGSRIYCGAPGLVAALDIPKPGENPSDAFSWYTEIDGTPWSMLAANKKLFVITQEGNIHCFGSEKRVPKIHKSPANPPSMKPTKSVELVRNILETSGVREGYCLVLGLMTEEMADYLAKESDLHVVGFEADSDKVDSLRRRCDARGIYGERIAFLPEDILSTPISPYLASLILSEDPEKAGYPVDAYIKKVFRLLRPYGGQAYFDIGSNKKSVQAFIEQINALDLPNAVVSQDDSGCVIMTREGALPGSSEWTHQYGDIGNTVCSKDQLVKPPLGLLWFGGPSHADVLPRHGHGPPQQVVDGRLFIEGIQVISARDVYTGRVLWRKELPGLNTYQMYYNESYVPDPYDRTYNQRHIPGANEYGTNFVVTSERIYLVREEVCLILDPATGDTLDEWKLPATSESPEPNWGYIGVYEDLLIAGAAPWRITEKDEEPIIQANNRFAMGSKYIVVMDRFSGKVLWTRKADYTFRHNAIVAGKDKLFCIDSVSEPKLNIMKRRGVKTAFEPKIFALNIRTGDEVWTEDKNVFGTWLGYSDEYDILLQAGSEAGDRARDEVEKGLVAYRGSDGSVIWESDRHYEGPCILYHDKIIPQTGGGTQSASAVTAFSLLNGEPLTTTHPLTGESIPWQWVRFKGCNTAIASEHLLTFRSASAAYAELWDKQGTTSIGGFRSGCTSNLVAADGVLNAPDYTRTCTCSYQNQTSLALVYMPPDDPDNPWVETWSFNYYPPPDAPKPVKRIGVNFGAPGNRFDEEGALWIEFPSVGGPSPDIPIYIDSKNSKLFRNHASHIQKENSHPNWVVSSGIEGEATIRIRPFIQPASIPERIDAFNHNAFTRQLPNEPYVAVGGFENPSPHTVRLFFAEPELVKPGDRVFDVYIQGSKVLQNFDMMKNTGGVQRPIEMEFAGIQIKDDLEISIKSADPRKVYMPIICGVEIIAENG